MTPIPLTWLYVPGDRPEVVAKALASGADVVIVDLEDAVAPDRKEYARAATAELLAEPQPRPGPRPGQRPGRPPAPAPTCRRLAALPGLSGLRLPKVTSPADRSSASRETRAPRRGRRAPAVRPAGVGPGRGARLRHRRRPPRPARHRPRRGGPAGRPGRAGRRGPRLVPLPGGRGGPGGGPRPRRPSRSTPTSATWRAWPRPAPTAAPWASWAGRPSTPASSR